MRDPPRVLAYASWSQGFRSGSYNGRPTSLEEIGSYNPERLDAFEVGVKSQIGRVLTLNLAAFRNQYRDQQLLISTVSKATGLIVVRTENVGRSRIQGLELRLAVDNVTNRRIITAGYDARSSFGFLEGYFNEPRRFWVTLSYRN